MSSLETAISAIAEKVQQHSETIHTEEAVKTSVILPFLRALGYDVFNPGEVIPEFTADTPGRRGEKVDYAIKVSDTISILIECKGLNTQLNERHLSQLYRYFTVTHSRFALLTNGREYQFFTDLDEPNRMDRRPFFVFDLLDYNSSALNELAKFAKSDFDVEKILAQAERLKYVSTVKKILEEWFENPPDNLTKLIAVEVYDGRVTSQVRDIISKATVAAFKEIVRDKLRNRISTALEDPEANQIEDELSEASESDVITTEEEIEGYLIIKALLRGVVPVDRIAMRDAKSYCAILLDNNNRKPIVRLHFNRAKKYVGFFDKEKEDRVPIETLDDLLEFGDRLSATVQKYA